MEYLQKRSKEVRGIALLLTVILLGSLIIITTSAAGLIFSLGQTVRNIGESERAYYAAEAGIENGLYLVEKQTATVDQLNNSSGSLSTGGAWTRTAYVTYSVPLNHPNVEATTPLQPISKNNALRVTLGSNQSFQMDLNIIGATVSYPLHLRVTWSGGGATRLIEFTNTGQVPSQIIGTNQKIPSTGNLDPTANLRFRLINESGNTIVYSISPDPSEVDLSLPMGLVIRSKGVSGSQERVLEVERKAWMVF